MTRARPTPNTLEKGWFGGTSGTNGIVMPLGQADHGHGNHRNKNKYFENCGGFADHLNAENVDPGDEDDQRERNQPVLPADDAGKIESQVIGEEHGVRTAEKK